MTSNLPTAACLESSLELLPVPAFICNLDGSLRFCNPALLELLGGTREQCCAGALLTGFYEGEAVSPEITAYFPDLGRELSLVVTGKRLDHPEWGQVILGIAQSGVTVDLQENFAGLNYEAAISVAGGDQELLKELAALFLEELPILIAGLRKAIAGQDAKGVERNAHTLKGSVGNFGARAAVEAASLLESQARNHELAGLEDSLKALEQALAPLITDLHSLGV